MTQTTSGVGPKPGGEAIVHLVHGTFARKAQWIREDSPLAARVRASLGEATRIVPFTWSAKNSHAARRDAATRLTREIRSSVLTHPGSPHYVIAHSHGGNVASYAMRDTEVRAGVSGVVCLGTPFIRARARDLSGARLLIRVVLIACIVTAIVFPVLGMVQALSTDAGDLETAGLTPAGRHAIEAVVASQFFPLYLAVSSALLFGSIAWLFSRPFVWLLRYANQKGLADVSAAQSEIVERLNASFGATPILVVDARGDEAAWWLRLVGAVATFPYEIWRPSRFLVCGLMVVGVLLAATIGLDSDHPRRQIPDPYLLLALPVTFFAMAGASVAVLGWLANLIWPAIFRSHPMGFGWDDFWQNFVVDIESARLPDDSEHVTHRVVRVGGKGFRHSRLYQEPAVFDVIGEWLTRSSAVSRPSTSHA